MQNLEPGRFQFADGRPIRSAPIKTERSCGKGELTESPNISRHSGPGRSFDSERLSSIPTITAIMLAVLTILDLQSQRGEPITQEPKVET